MAHESFEDEEVASVLNQYFISIKVDKEERPDIDSIYMTVCQYATGQGGWPLTILMTPEQKPFYAATYLPPKSRYGMLGLIDLLEQVRALWYTLPKEIHRSGNDLTNAIRETVTGKAATSDFSPNVCVQLALTGLKQNFDHEYGGFGIAPKFPTPHNLMFLLRYASLESDEQALYIVENTLEHMYRGGIYDHIGYGFSRYSTDQKWLVPHFEKMLYDNALLAIIYVEAYQYTKKPLYKSVAEQILEYIRREMTDKDGGFYCAQDADSDGVEGKYYIFTPEEIRSILGNEDAAFFNQYFDITTKGNFEGASIPNLIHCEELKEHEKIKHLCQKVYTYRRNRTTLHKDDKILTSWNALMITAYATAAKVLQNDSYIDAAKQAINFINTKLTDENGQLYVRYREGDVSFHGHIDDYAFYSMALLSVYEVTFDINYLKQSITITNQMLEQFWDNDNGGFYLSSKESEQLIYRPKEVYDGAIPSGNSVACYVLNRLANLTANSYYREYADKQITFLIGYMKDYPAGYCFSLLSFLDALYPSKEIVCVEGKDGDHNDLREYLSNHFEPNTVVLLKKENEIEDLKNIANYVVDYHIINDKTTYYICENHNCMKPTNTL